jgi:hypothetical protein
MDIYHLQMGISWDTYIYIYSKQGGKNWDLMMKNWNPT